jgi:naphthoate synthase
VKAYSVSKGPQDTKRKQDIQPKKGVIMEFEDIRYEKKDGIARIIINRPEKYNAFRTKTVEEMVKAFEDAEIDRTIGVVVLTGAGNKAFCTGGDATEVIGKAGYSPDMGVWITRLHKLIRGITKPVIAAVNGFAIGGGHVLHVICDLTIASENARFGQVGPRVGSFDAGYGTAYLTRVVGEKKAREIWMLCRQYTARQALEMGLVNAVVPPEKLEEETMNWCREILSLSPTALKFVKSSFEAESANEVGIEAISGLGTMTFYATEEALEGRNAYLEKRPSDFSKFRK